jgi:hypothetical protein
MGGDEKIGRRIFEANKYFQEKKERMTRRTWTEKKNEGVAGKKLNKKCKIEKNGT